MNKFLSKNWPLLVSFLIFVSITLLSYVDGKDVKEALRDGTLALLLSFLLKVIYRLHQYQNKIEEQKDTIGQYTKLLSATPVIGNTVSLTTDIVDRKDRFYNFFLSTVLDDYNSTLRAIQQGKYICNPDNELSITKKVLECCQKTLKAISYLDEDWWCNHEGTLYLKAHEENIDRKKEKATRIFLIDSSIVDKFVSVFKKHLELQIETHIIFIDKDKIDSKYLIDFVIYDDYLLRRAYEGMNDKGGKEALFTTDSYEVKKFSNYFDEILTIAKAIGNPIPE